MPMHLILLKESGKNHAGLIPGSPAPRPGKAWLRSWKNVRHVSAIASSRRRGDRGYRAGGLVKRAQVGGPGRAYRYLRRNER